MRIIIIKEHNMVSKDSLSSFSTKYDYEVDNGTTGLVKITLDAIQNLKDELYKRTKLSNEHKAELVSLYDEIDKQWSKMTCM